MDAKTDRPIVILQEKALTTILLHLCRIYLVDVSASPSLLEMVSQMLPSLVGHSNYCMKD